MIQNGRTQSIISYAMTSQKTRAHLSSLTGSSHTLANNVSKCISRSLFFRIAALIETYGKRQTTSLSPRMFNGKEKTNGIILYMMYPCSSRNMVVENRLISTDHKVYSPFLHDLTTIFFSLALRK
jgi:hypothetical protein